MNERYILTGMGLPNFCSNSLIKNKYPKARQIITNYGKPFPSSKIPTGNSLIIINFNYNKEILKDLNTKYNLTVITNSSKTINDVKELGIKHHVDNELSTVEITWNLCFPEKEISRAVKYIADWDNWEFKYDETKDFINGTNLLNLYPSSNNDYIWGNLIHDEESFVDDLLGKGRFITNFCRERDDLVLKDIGFEITMSDMKCLAANIRNVNSSFFDSRKHEDFDAFVIYGWIPSMNKWRVTIYANGKDKDITSILNANNGGGKPGVGGFVIDEPLPIIPSNQTSIFVDHLNELIKRNNDNNTFWSYSGKHDKISINSQLRVGDWNGFSCAFVNSPYTWTSVWRSIDVSRFNLGITFVYTNINQIRIVISIVNEALKIEDVVDAFGGQVVGRTIWLYIPTDSPVVDILLGK